jgi:hypothetical protein
MNGGTTLEGIFCERAVATLDFDCTKGNRVTQATAAMNQQAREFHFSPLRTAAPVKSGRRGAL